MPSERAPAGYLAGRWRAAPRRPKVLGSHFRAYGAVGNVRRRSQRENTRRNASDASSAHRRASAPRPAASRRCRHSSAPSRPTPALPSWSSSTSIPEHRSELPRILAAAPAHAGRPGSDSPEAARPTMSTSSRPTAACSWSTMRSRAVRVRRAARQRAPIDLLLPLARRAARRRLRRHPERRRLRRRDRRARGEGVRRHHPRAGPARGRVRARCRAAPSRPASPTSCCRSRDLAARLVRADPRKQRRLRAVELAEVDEELAAPHPRASARPHRPRLLEVQALDGAAAHRAAHAGDAHANDLEDYYDYLRENRRGGAGAAQRPADLGHHLLPRSGGVRGAGSRGRAAAVREQAMPTNPSASGCRAAPPARRPTSIAMLLLEEAARRELRPAIQVFALRPRRRARWRSRARPLSRRDRGRRVARSGCGASSLARATATASARRCATSCCSPPTTCSRTRRSRALDLISCRNLLIYLDRELQQQVLRHVPLRAAIRAAS